MDTVGIWQILLILIILLAFLLPLIALISILGNRFEGNEKLIWVLIVLFLPLIGTLLYFFIGYPKRIRK